MSYQTKKLLRLINEGKTCNEICEILHITNKQLYIKLTNLRNKGYHTISLRSLQCHIRFHHDPTNIPKPKTGHEK